MEGLFKFVLKGSFPRDAGKLETSFCSETELERGLIGCPWAVPVVYRSFDSGHGFGVGAGVSGVVVSARGRRNPKAARCCSGWARCRVRCISFWPADGIAVLFCGVSNWRGNWRGAGDRIGAATDEETVSQSLLFT